MKLICTGNLPYSAKPYDIEGLLATNGFHHLENIHISIDPVSARNPGYCFVDFPDRATADRALNSFTASINDRPIKVGPCEPKKKRKHSPSGEESFAFKRWGDWTSRSSDSASPVGRINDRRVNQGPHGALGHFYDMVHNSEGRRLYVGGLGKMINQAQHNTELTQIFAGFTPYILLSDSDAAMSLTNSYLYIRTAIGKRITPRENMRLLPGNHHYCFVDFETKEETDAARRATNGKEVDGNNLKVALANGIPEKLANRRTDVRYSRREQDEGYMRPNNFSSEDMATSNRSTGSSNWRRRNNS